MTDAETSTDLIWIDLEMTGLDPGQDLILEIATLVTDKDLNEIAVGPELALAAPEAALAGMDDWNQQHHGASGLIARVRESKVSAQAAEAATLSFLQQHLPAGVSPMCGNSIHQDRRFLRRYMPALEGYFHYRNLDVSTVKELCGRWRPELLDRISKQSAHRALSDIRESIAELRFYQSEFFR